MSNIKVLVQDANNVLLEVTPVPLQQIAISRGVAGRGIDDVQAIEIDNALYLEFFFTDGTTEIVGPVGTIQYIGESPIVVEASTISLSTVPVTLGGTGQITANAGFNALAPSQTGNAGKYLTTDGSNTSWGVNPLGTVTSVDMSVPTGLTISGNPITTSGTLAVGLQSGYSIPTTASQSNWDTAYSERQQWNGGATNLVAATGRTSLGLGTIATQDASNVSITGGTITGITDLAVLDGGTGASTAAGAMQNLLPSYTGNANKRLSLDSTASGLEWVTDGGGTVTSIDVSGGTTGLSFTGGPVTTSGTITLSGTLDLDNGGTGATTAADARTNLGAASSAITISAGTGLSGGGDLTANRTLSIANTAVTSGSYGSASNTLTATVNAQGQLTALAATPIAIANTQVSGLGTMSTQNSNAVTITGGSITGITDLAILDGGTGASTASGARSNLGLGTAAVLDAGVALGVATLDAGGTVPLSQIPASIQGGVNYQGSWNASTNTPTIVSGVGTKGYYYVVSVAGSTNIDGITDWLPGDWIIFNGTTWEQIDNTDAVASVNGYTGVVVLTASDVGAPPTTRTISAGTGLTGGGDLSTNRTISIANTAVTAASYGTASAVPSFTVNGQGQLTAASDVTIAISNTQVSGLGTMSTQNANSVAITGGSITGITDLAILDGGTGASTAADARTNLGVTATGQDTTYLYRANNLSDLASASTARTNLGLGTAATQNSTAFATAAQGALADTAIQTLTSTDGSVTITPTGTSRDLSVAVAAASTNVICQVRNTTGATVTKGTVVYISGATGQIPTISKALATSDTTSAQTLGMMTADLANNSNGYVTIIGLITNVDTSSYTDGQQLYLSGTTAGAVTGTKPYAPIHLVYVAVVEYAHPVNGKLFVKVQNGYELDELHNVSAQTPSNGQTIVYNSSTSLWENNTVSLTAGVNGTLPILNGGTGQTTANAAFNALAPSQTGNSGKYLTTDGTDTSWAANPLGTVTSVAMTVPTGLSISGSPITTSGTLAVTMTSGYAIPTTASQTNWDTAYSERQQWSGTSTNLVASTGRTSLGATTLGSNLFTITNPSAITFPRFNADNTVSALDAATFRTAIGAGTSSTTGTVTSVGGTGTVNGLTLTGTVTTSGSLTLGGTLSGIANSALTNSSITIGGTTIALGGSSNALANDITINGITVGRGAGALSTNTAVGYQAINATASGGGNAAFGYTALSANTTGSTNTALGGNTLLVNTTGSSNTAVGSQALQTNTTASNNTAVGYQAGYSNTTGTVNAFGWAALRANTTATQNSAFGQQSLASTSTGDANSAFGLQSLLNNTTGASNTAVGTYALLSNTTASNNTAVGYQSLYANTTGTSNDAFGFQALASNTTANGNSAFGRFSLYSNTTGALNIAMGTGAVQNNTTGSNNTGLGYQALLSNTTASDNTAVGYQAGYSNTTGTRITAMGQAALFSNTTGNYVVAVGRGAGYSNQTGSQSTFIGDNAGYTSTAGGNTFIGAASGYSVTTGTLNTFIGGGDFSSVYPSGYYVTTGSKNTILGNYNGNQGGLDIRTSSNNVVISDGDGTPRNGYDSTSQANFINHTSTYTQFNFYNTMVLKAAIWWDNSLLRLVTYTGTTAGPYVAQNGTSWTNSSDERLKNITGEIQNGLAKVCTLRAAEYTWKADIEAKPQVGLIAQDVLAVLPEAVEVPLEGSTNKDGSPAMMGVQYTTVIPLLIAAIKELKAEFDSYKASHP